MMTEKQLHTQDGVCRILLYDHLPSTNQTAREMASDGAPDGTVIIAREQSAGRGRLQRSFFSPGGTGLYMSLILRRSLHAADALRLTPLAAVATAEAIEEMIGHKVDIKWVNDIYLGGKKVCGILIEGAVDPTTQSLSYAVVGIGVNITPPAGGFPEAIRQIAGAVLPTADHAEALCDELAEKIICNMMTILDADPASVHEKYRSRLMLCNRAVTVHSADGTSSRPAVALDVDQDYRLKVCYEDGSVEHLDGGEVSIRWL